jgi:hypothetical protein
MKGGRNANGGRRAENKICDNYRFILPVRPSHFRYVSMQMVDERGEKCKWWKKGRK